MAQAIQPHVPRNVQDGLAGAAMGWLMQRVGNIARRQAEDFGMMVENAVAEGGRDAIYDTLREWATTLNNDGRNAIQSSLGGLQTATRNLINDIGTQIQDFNDRMERDIAISQARITDPGQHGPVVDPGTREIAVDNRGDIEELPNIS